MAPTFDDTRPYVPKIRLFVEHPLRGAGTVTLGADQTHYLQHVMRCKAGDEIGLFNGRDGEWCARIETLEKKRATLALMGQTRAQGAASDLWLLFAPVKRGPLDFIVEKATELGVSALCPVFTRFSVVDRVRGDRMTANGREAAEQCGRLDVPEVHAATPLGDVLDGWDPARTLIFCDEGGDVRPMAEAVGAMSKGPAAILIGPEGGFHADERARLRALPYVIPVSLGPRILRADTAAVAALALFQALQGDWREAP